MKVEAIILAAGESKRMGTPKMLLPFGSKSILETVIDNIENSGIIRKIIVLGSEWEKILDVISGRSIDYVVNYDYSGGMITSVRQGIKSLSAECDAAIICLGDQPMAGPEVIKSLLKSYYSSEKAIIIPVFNGKRGHPVIIGRKYFSKIDDLSDNDGLRSLIWSYPEDTLEIGIDTSAVLRDIDTPAQYEYELKQLK